MYESPTRLDRLHDVERAVRGVRWFGVLFALGQIGFLYEPPAGVALPFPRLPVAAAFAAALIALNLLSLWVQRHGSERGLRLLGIVGLVADTLLVFAIVALFAFDDESRLWPLYVLPILEGALREQMRGALGAAVAALVGNVVVFGGSYPTPELVSSTGFQAGVLLILALTTGFLARRFEDARATAEGHASRLRELAEHASALAAERRSGAVFAQLCDAACALTGLELCEVHTHAEDGWTREFAVEPDRPGARSLVDTLLTERRFNDVVVVPAGDEPADPDSPVQQLLLAPIGSGVEPTALLVLGTTDPQRRIAETDQDLVRLLVGHATVALDNARIAEAEAHTIQELQALDAVKDEFVHILVHELKAPMTAMTGYATLLRRRWDQLPDGQRQEFLENLERGTYRLARLVKDVQEVSLAEREELPIDAQPVELRPLLERIAAEEVEISDRHRLEVAYDDDAPTVRADPDRLAQILHNLLSNAVKYSPDGGRVRVQVDGGPHQVTVTVTDDGFGIPTHLRQHLFRKFSRLPTPERIEGTGLGLYLTRHLIEAMGGTIDVDSTPGRGSTFRFTVPVAEATDELSRVES